MPTYRIWIQSPDDVTDPLPIAPQCDGEIEASHE